MSRLFFLLLLVFPLGLLGQEPPAVGVKATKEIQPAEDAATKDKPSPKESARLQKLKQLTFDRRPATMLEVWSKPWQKEAATKKPKDAPKDAPKKDEQTLRLEAELAAFQRYVTLGKWPEVAMYLAGLPEDEGKAGYQQLLQSLAGGPPGSMVGPVPGLPPQVMQMLEQIGRFREKNQCTVDDLLGLAAAAPRGLDKDALDRLGGIARVGFETGQAVEHFVARLKIEIAKPPGHTALSKRQAAHVLVASGQAAEAGDFLPPLAKAADDNDHDALILLTRHFLARHAKEKKVEHLEQAWSALQSSLAAGTPPRAELEASLRLAVELAPKVKAELGQAWLDQSFTRQAQRGMDILTTIAAGLSQAVQRNPMETDLRLKGLELLKTAVDALVKAAPEQANAWRQSLTLLASYWLREAEIAYQFDRSTGFGPRLRRDFYGNFFYTQDEDAMPPHMMGFGPQLRAIPSGKLLDIRPDGAWLERVDQGLRPKLAMIVAQLYLKVGEEAKAFPYIEHLAKGHEDKAKALVSEFLRVWTKNHNPNEARDRINPYVYYFGFERRAESIPLTRSKQERNLVELAEWVNKLRALGVGEPDEELLTKAFTTCHSSAEVYRMEAIEKVFGQVGKLKPKTLAGLSQKMRENLVGLWREPNVQKDKKTNRKTKDIQAEVLRGYALAATVLDNGLKQFAGDWALLQARAALWHDENNYRQELAKSSQFSRQRQQALALFGEAARQYAAKVRDLSEDDETTQVYEQWFYASLGACDLGHITDEKLPDVRQPALIRKAILSLPGEAAERHMGKFANSLFTRLSAVGPAVKFRYLKAGLEIVSDHKLAHEARKVYEYYKDLVTEIKLDAVVDGSDVVGHKQAFGVFVNLRHTREIERESGGFGRYLQNQNAGGYWYYNYGRPLADYRDKFTAIVNEALKEHFEVVSITFQSDKVNSRALSEYGWRYTPYAYLLLKARGPQVDKLPPLRLDLDFLETSGYVIIPIESPAVPLDCKSAKAPARPFQKLQLTQTLDERQADKGKLILEVKATALGLVPDLDQVVNLALEGFEIVKTDDHGVSVARFDPDHEQNVMVSERAWLVTLRSKDGAAPPDKFAFATAKVDPADMTYQRYQDADLVSVPQTVSLAERYGSERQTWWWWLAGSVAFLLVLGAAVLLWGRRTARRPEQTWHLPEPLTPFTVLGLLKRIQQHNNLAASLQQELSQSVTSLEHRYFAQTAEGNGEVELKTIAETWIQRARGLSRS